MSIFLINYNNINSLDPGDTRSHHGPWSTLVDIMDWCLIPPSHYLSQCWLVESWGIHLRAISQGIHIIARMFIVCDWHDPERAVLSGTVLFRGWQTVRISFQQDNTMINEAHKWCYSDWTNWCSSNDFTQRLLIKLIIDITETKYHSEFLSTRFDGIIIWYQNFRVKKVFTNFSK